MYVYLRYSLTRRSDARVVGLTYVRTFLASPPIPPSVLERARFRPSSFSLDPLILLRRFDWIRP